jgi:hypothetical protein
VNVAFGKVAQAVRRPLGAGAFHLDAHKRVVYTPSDGKPAEIA